MTFFLYRALIHPLQIQTINAHYTFSILTTLVTTFRKTLTTISSSQIIFTILIQLRNIFAFGQSGITTRST